MTRKRFADIIFIALLCRIRIITGDEGVFLLV